MKRFIIVVMDSVGCGELPDAAAYNSYGASTLSHISMVRPLSLPNLQSLGLGNITPLVGVPAVAHPQAAWGKMAERSCGKDTTTGHWEMAGQVFAQPLPTYPDGFPDELINAFCAEIGCGVLGNCVASGTEIIKELGEEHMRTGFPIIYTSADSVCQLAAHEQIIPPEKLYEICEIARRLWSGKHGVGRVIARPFVGTCAADFTRTGNRRDFSLLPEAGNLLENVQKAGLPVTAIGKIHDIFAGQHMDEALPGHDNEQSMDSLYKALDRVESGLIFANFVDFDMLYGHRNDPLGYAAALESFDAGLPDVMRRLRNEDILVICADHGNDPTTPSTDHDREYVPLLVCGNGVRTTEIGIRSSFADLGQTAAEYLGAAALRNGSSFLKQLK